MCHRFPCGRSDLLRLTCPLWCAAVSFAFTVERNGTSVSATTRQYGSRIVALAVGNGLLLLLILGTWAHVAWPTVTNFVDVVPHKDVTLSEAGAPPRSSYSATMLIGGELQSAYCYVTVDGSVWLDFHDGWAPLSAFHYPTGLQQRLPQHCE